MSHCLERTHTILDSSDSDHLISADLGRRRRGVPCIQVRHRRQSNVECHLSLKHRTRAYPMQQTTYAYTQPKRGRQMHPGRPDFAGSTYIYDDERPTRATSR